MTPAPRSHRTRLLRISASTAATALTASILTVSATATAQTGPNVLISELANAGSGGSADEIIELTNYGDAPADLDGWSVYRCAGSGSRAYQPQIPPLDEIVLEPGETFVLTDEDSTIDDADAYYTTNLNNDGFGVRIEDAQRNIIDGVAVYAAPVDSECSLGDTPLPNDLNGVRNQTWQRTGDTGVIAADFIRAERTAGEANATEPDEGVVDSDVLISELTNAGPNGSGDDFVEFANYGDEAVDIGDWEFYRCWGSGRSTPSSLQATIPSGTVLEPGEVFVAAHDPVDVPDEVPHAYYGTSLANAGFGAMLLDSGGSIRDSVGVYETDGYHQPPTGSPCTQGEALPNRLDFGWNQTWQRTGDTGDNAADFVKAERTLGELAEPDAIADPEPVDTGVQISEIINAGPDGAGDDFFELANFGDQPVSLEGWNVHRCQEDGRRSPSQQIPTIGDVVLDPGETYLAVHTSSPLFDAGDYDASYSTGFASGGFGLMVLTDQGALADSVGVYNATYSPCTQGLSLVNIIDFGGGESYQRLDQTAFNADDFVPAERSPGTVPDDLRQPTDYTDEQLAPVEVDPAGRPLAPETAADVGTGRADLSATVDHTTAEAAELAFTGAERIVLNDRSTRVYTGTTDAAVPATRVIDGEQRAEADVVDDGEPLVTESSDGYPFQRYEMRLDASQRSDFEITWTGASTGTNEIQMYAWNHWHDIWDLVAADGGLTGGQITLTGAVDHPQHVRGRGVDVLIIDGPATAPAFSDDAAEPNLAFKDPAEYDLSFGYVTDTQFLSEGYREAFAEMTRWIAQNGEGRKIEYTSHTGDLIQNWLNGTHSTARAEDEYAFASDTMAILEQAGQPYGVVPGNHDNKWGRKNEMYNEHFPVERFSGQPWFGDSWLPDDAQNHYDVIEVDGAKFLFLYLGYFAGDDAIEWANQVLAEHPDHNVVFATHEYIQPDGSLATPDNYRWTSLADRYWNEIVLPNENIFMVLAGHFHGMALNIKRDVGGVEGRVVVEMMANYQGFEDEENRNAGFMRLLQVDVDAGLMAVNTYSPQRDEHNAWEYTPDDVEFDYDDTDDEFTVEVDLNGQYYKRIATDLIAPHQAAETIATATVGDGETAEVAWEDLRRCTDYVWAVDAADATGRTARSAAAVLSTPGRGGRECD